jgi:AcrR family transcriptional regulator
MDSERPLRRDARENRARILVAASEVFAERGPDGALEEVARRAGVGVGTLYRRFPTREALVGALFDDTASQLIAWADEGGGADDAFAYLAHYLERAMTTPLASAVIRDMILARPLSRERQARLLGELVPALARLVASAQEQRTLRADVVAQDIPPLVFALAAIASETRAIAPDLWRRYLGIMLDGLRPTGASPLPQPPLTRDQLRQRFSRAGR